MVEIGRDRWGRPLIPAADGGPATGYTRVTTISEIQGDRYHIEKWKERSVVLGMGRDPELIRFAKMVEGNETAADKKVLNGIAEQAHKAAKSDQKALDGTELHDIFYKIHRGDVVEIPDKWRRHVAEWKRITADWTFVNTEQMVISDTHSYAGTPDAFAVIPAIHPTLPICVDYKTGKSVDFGIREMAAQLAMYVHGEFLWEHRDGLDRRPMPERSMDVGVIFHINANGGGVSTLYQLDLVEGWEAAQRSMAVKAWRGRTINQLTTVIPVGEPVEQWLRRRIMRLSVLPGGLERLSDRMLPEWGNLTSGIAMEYEAAIVKSLEIIEDQCQAPFAERHPLSPTTTRKRK